MVVSLRITQRCVPTLKPDVKSMSPSCNKEILLVSLGTGELTKKLDYHEARDWGKV